MRRNAEMFFSYETRPTNRASGRRTSRKPAYSPGTGRNWNSAVSTPWVHSRRLRKPRDSSIRSTPAVGTITPDEGAWKWRISAYPQRSGTRMAAFTISGNLVWKAVVNASRRRRQ
jgi:hypothetical protein